MLDITDLRMVETITQTGSLTRAAEDLHVSQPTLSKRLSRLESQLGAKLFHRAPHGLSPTQIAHYLVEQSQPLKANITSIERQVERIVNHDQGELKIGVGPIIEQVLLPDVLVKLAQQTGAVRVNVLTEHADVLIAQLRTGELDVIAGPFGVEIMNDVVDGTLAQEGIQSIELIHESTINVARSDHPIFSSQNPDISDYGYASPALQGSMQTDRTAKTPATKRPLTSTRRARLLADNYTLLKSVALKTDYICGGPRQVFAEELRQGTVREVTPSASLQWRSACLVKAEALETPLVSLFIDTLKACRDEYLLKHGDNGL